MAEASTWAAARRPCAAATWAWPRPPTGWRRREASSLWTGPQAAARARSPASRLPRQRGSYSPRAGGRGGRGVVERGVRGGRGRGAMGWVRGRQPAGAGGEERGGGDPGGGLRAEGAGAAARESAARNARAGDTGPGRAAADGDPGGA